MNIALGGLKVNWIAAAPRFTTFQWLPLPFSHNPTPFPGGPPPSPNLYQSSPGLLGFSPIQASPHPGFTPIQRNHNLSKTPQVRLVPGPFGMSSFQAFHPDFCMTGFSHLGLREPLPDQLSRTAPPLPALQPLLNP